MTTGHEPLPFEQHGQDLTDALDEAKKRGYTNNFAYRADALHCRDTGEDFAEGQAWIADSISVDMGTDPGDDATVYLIDTDAERRGYIVIPASFYAEPGKAAFIDRLKTHTKSTAR